MEEKRYIMKTKTLCGLLIYEYTAKANFNQRVVLGDTEEHLFHGSKRVNSTGQRNPKFVCN